MGFSLVEFLLMLAILLIVGGFVARIVYFKELDQIDDWFAETFGFSHLWMTFPLIALYGYHRAKSRKKKHSSNDRLVLPDD